MFAGLFWVDRGLKQKGELIKTRFMQAHQLIIATFLFSAVSLTSFATLTNDPQTLLLLRFDGDLTGVQGETPGESSGITFETGIHGQGAYLAPGNRLFYPSAGNINSTNGTIEFWVKPRWAGDNHADNLFLRFGFAGGMLLMKTGANDLFAMFNRWGAEGNPEVTVWHPVGDWPPNEWRHVALTWCDDMISLYLNGDLKMQVAPGFPLPTVTDADFRIGAADFGNSADAVFDELRISSVVRTPGEIINDFLDGLKITSFSIEPGANNLGSGSGELQMMPTWWNYPVLSAVTDLGTMELPASTASWSSSDPSVATLDAEGRIVAGTPSVATLWATFGTVSNSLAVQVLSPMLPPSEDAIDPELATPATNHIWEMQVVVIRYLPTQDGINLDASLTDYTATLAQMRSRIDLLDRRTKFMLEEGSRYHGYKNPGAVPALGYRIIRLFTFYEPMPKGKQVPGGSDHFPAYDQILARINAGTLVTNESVREFWLWAWHANGIVPAESNMSSPLTRDISNSYRFNNDMPVFDRTYVLYNYNYTRGQNEAVHDHGHQLEAILSYACEQQDGNNDLFWNDFCGRNPDGSFQQGRVGNTHYPPNGTSDYDYGNTAYVMSDCEDWTPAGTGQTKNVNCQTWGDIPYAWPTGTEIADEYERTEAQYYIYWMQNMPGIGNRIPYYGPNRMTVWWAFTGDWDNSLKCGLGLYAPTNATAPAITIHSFSTDSEGAKLAADYQAGVLYTLESSASLDSPAWRCVYDQIEPIPGTGLIEFKDGSSEESSRFYRVKGIDLINSGE